MGITGSDTASVSQMKPDLSGTAARKSRQHSPGQRWGVREPGARGAWRDLAANGARALAGPGRVKCSSAMTRITFLEHQAPSQELLERREFLVSVQVGGGSDLCERLPKPLKRPAIMTSPRQGKSPVNNRVN